MRPPARIAAPLLGALGACLIAACGGSSHHRSHTHPRGPVRAQTVEIYSSLPLVGPSGPAGRAIELGIRLALLQSGRRAGDFLVRYRSLDDARVGHGPWSGAPTAANARQAAIDPAAMIYIGDFDSSATRVSLPILNEAGIPQISPWSPYVGLTRAVGEGVTTAGDPGRYYPSSMRTLLRLAPGDAVQAAALLTAAHDAGCTRMGVLRSGGTQDYSSELAGLLDFAHARFGVRIVASGALAIPSLAVSPGAALRRYVGSLRTFLAGCVAYLGAPSAGAISAIAAIHAALPRAQLFASDRVCQAAFVAGALRSELAAASGGLLDCTLPALPIGPAARAGFAALWRSRLGGAPPLGPWAAYGYEAMRLAMGVISDLGPHGDQRSRLLRALFGVSARGTLLGDYGFNSNGDSTVQTYGLWRIRPVGPPRLVRVMQR